MSRHDHPKLSISPENVTFSIITIGLIVSAAVEFSMKTQLNVE